MGRRARGKGGGITGGTTRGLALLGGALATLVATGCYDSTWGSRKAAEVHNAARAMPATLTAATSSPGPADVTVLRVRIHATAAYAAQTPDWKAHASAILDEASTTLEASIGARLVLASAEPWSSSAHAHLSEDLAALREEDTGDGADLVLGLVGGLPLTSRDFEQAGMSLLGGKFLVERAPDAAAEYEAIAKSFDELGEDDRARLRRERLRHREVAVLLHEIGHALGASHQQVAGSIMRPAYDPKMTAFDDVSIASMREGLARRAGGDTGAKAAAVASSPPAAKDAESAPTPPGSTADDAPAELSAGDRDVWHRAMALAQSGNAAEAWKTATPLFAAYPRSYAVQDRRCKLAMACLGTYEDVRQECDALMQIALPPRGAKR